MLQMPTAETCQILFETHNSFLWRVVGTITGNVVRNGLSH